MQSNAIIFPMETAIVSRVDVMAPMINQLIQDHENGESKDGVEAFQHDLLVRIDSAGLLEKDQWYELDNVGIHPDNREKAMCVPVDSQDLLSRFAEDGWNYGKWNALACKIPENIVQTGG